METRKFLALAIMALPLLAACEKNDKSEEEEGGGNIEVTMSSIAGEWYLNVPNMSDTDEETLVIKNDGSFVLENSYSYEYDGKKVIGSQTRTEGRFTLNGTTLTSTVSKVQYRYSEWENGEYKGLKDWQDEEYSDMFETAQVSLLRGGAVLLFSTNVDDNQDVRMSGEKIIYFKKGAKLPSDKSELQGTWFCMEEYMGPESGEAIRIAVRFDGDNIDLIVVPWSQRFICKYNYKDGMVSSTGEVVFRTLWREDGCNEMNMSDPFDSEWLPTYDPEQYTGNLTDGFAFPFIVDGKNAYSRFVGLSPFYTKQ